jgi:hypothetical protein
LARGERVDDPAMGLPSKPWQQVDDAVDRALRWMASQQQADGRMPTKDSGQPGVTSLCILSFMAHGHLPGEGPYGNSIERGFRFVMQCQQPDGLLAFQQTRRRKVFYGEPSHTATYNHAVSALLLSEVYGMTNPENAGELRNTIQRALDFAYELQVLQKREARDIGAWRYVRPHTGADSDVSITSWYLLFLRSAKNAGFDVQTKPIEEALQFVVQCFDPGRERFAYSLDEEQNYCPRGTVGAGILSLSMGGKHGTEMARVAGDWILANPFPRYNTTTEPHERYHYGIFYCSQAMFQLGGKYWRDYYNHLMREVLPHQLQDGSWPAEDMGDRIFGRTCSTAFAVLALSGSNQSLPIFQR